MAKAARHPHGALHHLDRPCNVDPGTRARVINVERCLTLQIAVNSRIDMAGRLAIGQLNTDPHAVREGWRDHSVQHGAGRERRTVAPELLKPGPPTLELIELLQGAPQLLWRLPEFVLAAVGQDRPPCHLVDASDGEAFGRRASSKR